MDLHGLWLYSVGAEFKLDFNVESFIVMLSPAVNGGAKHVARQSPRTADKR